MSLDLGALVGRVVLSDAEFQRTYMRVVRQMGSMGESAGAAAAETARLDEALTATGRAGAAAAPGLQRAAAAAARQAKAETDAAAAATRHAEAQSRVTAMMSEYAGAGAKAQAAILRQVAAEERLVALQARGTATTRELAAAQASVVSATDRANAAMAASAASTSRWRGALASGLRTAGQLGLVFGAFEAVKKAIDITHEAAQFQRSMVMIHTLTGASTAEMHGMAQALLGMSGRVGQAPEELAVSLYHMESIGLRGAAALKGVRVAAEGAAIGQSNLEDTTNAMTATIASGIAKTHDFGRVMSTILSIVGAGDMKMQDFNETLGSGVLAILATYGVTLRDFGAAIAVFGDNNIRGAHAATMLRVAVQSLASPAAGGADALARLNLNADTLSTALAHGGLAGAMKLLHDRIASSGIAARDTGKLITEAFTKRGAAGINVLLQNYDRLQNKYGVLDRATDNFGKKWQETQATASFALQRIGAFIDAEGVRIASGILPGVNAVVSAFGRDLPAALHLVGQVAGPTLGAIGTGLHMLWTLGGDAVRVLTPLGHIIGDIATPLGNVGAAAVGAWLAFRAVNGVILLVGNLVTFIKGIPAAFTAMQARVAASTDAYVASMANIGRSSAAAATTATASMGAISDEAAVMSGTVAAEGEAATIGWAGLLGPLAAVGVGVTLLFSLFNRSSHSAQDNADATNAYAEALKNADPRAAQLDATLKQMDKNNVPETMDALNASLGRTAISGKQFIAAINNPRAYRQVSADLQHIIDLGTRAPETYARGLGEQTPAAQNAAKLLAELRMQYDALTNAQKRQLSELRNAGQAAAPIQSIADQLHLTSDAAKQYAAMAGLAVTADNNVIGSARASAIAIRRVHDAYMSATGSGAAFLKSLSDFSTSAGNAADRASLIGSTLVAANGDALAFASAMNASANAAHQLGVDARQAASQVGKGGESTKTWLRSVVNLKRGTIDYHRTAAQPLITDLNQIQSAGMAAAQAEFQHARATMSGKAAADAAYRVYRSQTRGALIDQVEKLGAGSDAAKRLADRYLGMPKRVKTLIEQEGADPIVTVLNKIGQQLAFLTGHPWTPRVTANTDDATTKFNALHSEMNIIKSTHMDPSVHADISGALANIRYLQDQLNNLQAPTVYVHVQNASGGGFVPGNATGTGSGVLPRGVSAVGERGPELAITDTRGTAILSNAQSRAFLSMTGMRAPGFAAGTNARVMSYITGAGFRGDAADTAYGIAGAESGFNATAHNGVPPDNSYGLFQINMIGSLGPERRRAFHLRSNNDLFNPAVNARVAFALSRHGRDFSPWTTYTSGRYRQWMSDSEGAHVRHGHGAAPGRAGGGGGSSAAQAANQRRATAVGGASSAISAVNGIPAGPRFQQSTFNEHAFEAQVAAARRHIDVAKAAGASAETLKHLRDRLADITREGRKAEQSLKMHVAAQIGALSKAIADPTAGSFASALASLNANLRRTGAPDGVIARVTKAEAALEKQRVQVLASNAKLGQMTTYRAGVRSNLLGRFDPTQSGSIQDLEAGLRGATGGANQFRSEIARLRHSNLDQKFVTRLIASGPSATLTALAGGNHGQFAYINRELGRYRHALGGAADAAVLQRFGISVGGQREVIAREHHRTDQLLTRMAHVAGLLSDLKHVDWNVYMDGEKVSRKVTGSRAMESVVDSVVDLLEHGRGRHG